MALRMPEVCFAENGEVDIAYQVLGQGPPDLVFVAGAATHLRVLWEQPAYRRFCEALASFARVMLFDKRGMGMSDRTRVGTLEERMEDVRAVMDTVGSQRAALFGISEGGPMSMLFAATYPDRTSALILSGSEVKEEKTDDWPWGECTAAEFEEYLRSVPRRWGKGLSLDWLLPSAARDDEMRAWLGRLQVESMSPRGVIALSRIAFAIDVRDVAAAIDVPTLILHRVDDRTCPVGNGRWLAEHIHNSRYRELAGADHLVWGAGSDEILDEVREFLTGVREPVEPQRVLTTVLFTDIVGSTELATSLGDRGWRDLLERHDELIRAEVARFQGDEIKTMGDGLFAAFDGPARAIRCACSAVESAKGLGLKLRAGLHTGECERVGADLSGIAVHVGARVAAHAKAGEVLVSSTVRDLVAGSGIEFREIGLVELKGVGQRQIAAVVAV
jgi:class 3 adenylate cyclase